MQPQRSTMFRMIIVAAVTALALQGGRGCVKRSASKAITEVAEKAARSGADDVVREVAEQGYRETDRFHLGLSVLRKGVSPKLIALVDDHGLPIEAPSAVERRAQEEAARFWEAALQDLPSDQALSQRNVLATFKNKLDAAPPNGFSTGSGGQTLRITLRAPKPSTVLVDLEASAMEIADEFSKEATRTYLDSLRLR